MAAHLENSHVPAGEVRLWRKHPAVRLLLYSATTVTLGALAIFVFMPAGLAGVPYVGLVFAAYLFIFVMMAFIERSVWLNAAMGPIFFASMLVIDGHYGADALWLTATTAAIHAMVQGGLAAVIHLPERRR
jgi:hypothetical protein